MNNCILLFADYPETWLPTTSSVVMRFTWPSPMGWILNRSNGNLADSSPTKVAVLPADPGIPTYRGITELPHCFNIYQRGVFVKPQIDAGALDGVSNCYLTLTVKLDIKDSSGVPLIAHKKYNYSLRGRGRSDVLLDYRNWIGKEISSEDLWAFDARKFAVGKPAIVELEVRRHKRVFDLRIKSIHPPTFAIKAATNK